uniref:AGE family epimerase/isomerase n=1 Tax=uncultured Sphingomonas sp. TaxID=158754 RepID=UPI0035CC8DFD
MTSAIRREAAVLTDWLVDKALPLWATRAADPAGGYFEAIDMHGRPEASVRRCYVAARHVYVFAIAADFGWDGATPARRALDFLTSRFRHPDGTYASAFDPATGHCDDRFDLYDHAFVLFALAIVAGRSATPQDVERSALHTLCAIQGGWSHPAGGFDEAVPRTLPLRANPHMHLFEAALEWLAVPGIARTPWMALADEIGNLCLRSFISPHTGALHEFFDGDWSFAPGDLGRRVEPGHQFEWAWLLVRWGKLRHRPDAVDAARRMADLAERRGVVAGVAVNALWEDLTLQDSAALLWPQTERIKAWAALAMTAETASERQSALESVVAAAAGLRRYLDTPIDGLWFMELDRDGVFSATPSLGRYLYHIVCAIQELSRVALRLG